MIPETDKQVLIYETETGTIEVQLEQDSVWLNQAQLAELFGTQRPAVTKYLGNIFKTKELDKDSVCSILEHTAKDGKCYRMQHYNLDAIISVGYRVNSSNATRFRIWATARLKEHLVQGYTFNEYRLRQHQTKIKQLEPISRISSKWSISAQGLNASRNRWRARNSEQIVPTLSGGARNKMTTEIEDKTWKRKQ